MFQGFYQLIYNQLFKDGYFIDGQVGIVEVFNGTIYFSQYLAILMALICTVIVYILCCLAVYKVIRLFGRLWSRF